MKKNIPAETYNIIPPQEMINFMLKYSLHKQVIQIPVSITVNKKVDFDILKKALNIEIERNDCMRLRFFKEKKKIKQYFIDEYKVDSVPVVSFSSKEEQEAYLTADAQKPIRHLKGEIFRMIFFTSYEGKSGIYINVSHLCMDAAAVFLFFGDLLAVYDHLTEGKPMPKPLGSYKDIIKKELAFVADKDRMAAEEKFYTDFFLKDGEPFYAGVHGPGLLEKERKKKKNPELRAPSCFDPIHDKAELVKRGVSKEDSEKIIAFCEKNTISPECLVQLGMRTHVSKINYRTPDVYFVTLCARRSTVTEKRSGGTTAAPLPWREVIPEDMTFMQALDKMAEVQGQLFRHMDYPYLECRELVRRLFNYSPIAASSTMMFSWFPLNKNTMNGWEYEFSGYSLGSYIMQLYSFAMVDAPTGCLKFAYLYRTNTTNEQHINDLHDNTIKVLVKGVENPDITIGELMDIL